LKILLLGKDGQVGWALQRSLLSLGELVCLGRQGADFTNIEGLRLCIRHHRPDIIVNAAAYTAVDKAESESEKARLINVDAVNVLAEEATKLGAWLVHYSTDYVFDGTKLSPYDEEDLTAPLSVYGQTKLAGESVVRISGCKHLILRSSWVYSIYGGNFPFAILRRALELEQIDVVDDSFGAPTSAELIADVTALMLYRITTDHVMASSATGTYHLVASGETSWYEYAKFLIGLAKKKGLPVKVVPNKIFPVSGDSYKMAAKRPKNCRLSNSKINQKFGLTLPCWKVHVARFVDELVKAKSL
jgi:dTDP-4-dehydrorhamnose reductase